MWNFGDLLSWCWSPTRPLLSWAFDMWGALPHIREVVGRREAEAWCETWRQAAATGTVPNGALCWRPCGISVLQNTSLFPWSLARHSTSLSQSVCTFHSLGSKCHSLDSKCTILIGNKIGEDTLLTATVYVYATRGQEYMNDYYVSPAQWLKASDLQQLSLSAVWY